MGVNYLSAEQTNADIMQGKIVVADIMQLLCSHVRG